MFKMHVKYVLSAFFFSFQRRLYFSRPTMWRLFWIRWRSLLLCLQKIVNPDNLWNNIFRFCSKQILKFFCLVTVAKQLTIICCATINERICSGTKKNERNKYLCKVISLSGGWMLSHSHHRKKLLFISALRLKIFPGIIFLQNMATLHI